jgi:hypothetical protein
VKRFTFVSIRGSDSPLARLHHPRAQTPLYLVAVRVAFASSLRKPEGVSFACPPIQCPQTSSRVSHHGPWYRGQRDVHASCLTKEEASPFCLAIVQEPKVHLGLLSEEIHEFTEPSAIACNNSKDHSPDVILEESVHQSSESPAQQRPRVALESNQAGAEYELRKEQGEWSALTRGISWRGS